MSTADTNAAIGKVLAPILTYIVNPLIDLLMLVAVVVFVWGVVQLIMGGDEAEARSNGQRHMLWGIIGLFVMLSAFGIIRLVAATLNVQLPFF